MVRSFLLALVFVLLGAAAPAEPEDCRDDRGVDRCAAEQQAEVLRLFGLRPIQEHLRAGDEVRRAFFVDGYGRDVVAVSFIRPRGHDPSLSLSLPRADGERSPLSPMQAGVPLDLWNEVISRSSHFDRQLVPLAQRADGPVICMHSWVYTVEAADPDERDEADKVRKRTEDACSDGLAEPYAFFLAEAAVKILPPCAALDPKQHRNLPTLLGVCGRLAGDRLAAAQAVNAMVYALQAPRGPENQDEIVGLFGDGALLEWDGAKSGTKFGEAAAMWVGKMAESPSHLWWTRAVGETASRVRMTGFVERHVDDPGSDDSVRWSAPAEVVWEDINFQGLRISRLIVGKFERTPSGR